MTWQARREGRRLSCQRTSGNTHSTVCQLASDFRGFSFSWLVFFFSASFPQTCFTLGRERLISTSCDTCKTFKRNTIAVNIAHTPPAWQMFVVRGSRSQGDFLHLQRELFPLSWCHFLRCFFCKCSVPVQEWWPPAAPFNPLFFVSRHLLTIKLSSRQGGGGRGGNCWPGLSLLSLWVPLSLPLSLSRSSEAAYCN